MQICFRCNESINVLLEKYACADGISKNRLINDIVKSYLTQKTNSPAIYQTDKLEKQILSELCLTNEILTQILSEINEFYFNLHYQYANPEFKKSFDIFRTSLIYRLTDISKKLDAVRKEIDT